MSGEESRSPTFDGTRTADETGQTADVSGTGRDGGAAGGQSEGGEQPKQPNDAAQIVP